MKAEASALLALAALSLLLGTATPAGSFAGLGKTEVWLAFSLVFTFVAGMEVVR